MTDPTIPPGQPQPPVEPTQPPASPQQPPAPSQPEPQQPVPPQYGQPTGQFQQPQQYSPPQPQYRPQYQPQPPQPQQPGQFQPPVEPGRYQQPAQPQQYQQPGAYQQQPTYLQTVPTAIYQAPSQGGYAQYQGDAQGQGARPMPQTSTRAVWALVTGIIGLVISIFVGWGFPFSIAAIVLGFISRRRETAGRGFALTGIITGFIGLALSAGWLTYSIVTIIGYLAS